jgi:hypothetical protein
MFGGELDVIAPLVERGDRHPGFETSKMRAYGEMDTPPKGKMTFDCTAC